MSETDRFPASARKWAQDRQAAFEREMPRDRVASPTITAESVTFDQRPGALEATRGMDGLPVVVGHQDPDGWKVMLLFASQRLALTPAQTRKLCVQMIGMADLIDDGFLP